MSAALSSATPARRPNYRLRRALAEAGSAVVAIALLIWWLLPIYNMFFIAIDPDGRPEFSGYIWPPEPTLKAFHAVVFEGYWYLEHFWQELGNSLYIGLASMVLTVLISSLASSAIGRSRMGRGWAISSTALFIYIIPQYFLVIPYYVLIHAYGLMNSMWAVIAVNVTFSVPFALLILQWYGRLIPAELDEAARVDGASPIQIYRRIYLPLMAPALAAVGTYALLMAWNEYLYQFLLLTSPANKTVAITLAQFFNADESPWNYFMAAAIIYCVPPIVVFYALRRYMASGLTLGGVKG